MSSWIQDPVVRNAIATAAWFAVVAIFRWSTLRALRSWAAKNPDLRLQWIVHSRNISLLILAIGIVVIWATEIRSVAFSLVALAVAFVIGTKELISSALGGLMRGGARPFSVGDRIEIQHYRGDVIDLSLFTTTILEIGPGQMSHQYTGRAVVLPNSIFLSNPIINETFTDEFVLHVFRFPLTIDDDWRAAEAGLLKAAREECRSFLEEARRHMHKLGRDRGLDPPNVEPRISITFPEPHRVDMIVRIPAPARRKGRIEQAILRRFLSEFAGFSPAQNRPRQHGGGQH